MAYFFTGYSGDAEQYGAAQPTLEISPVSVAAYAAAEYRMRWR